MRMGAEKTRDGCCLVTGIGTASTASGGGGGTISATGGGGGG